MLSNHAPFKDQNILCFCWRFLVFHYVACACIHVYYHLSTATWEIHKAFLNYKGLAKLRNIVAETLFPVMFPRWLN